VCSRITNLIVKPVRIVLALVLDLGDDGILLNVLCEGTLSRFSVPPGQVTHLQNKRSSENGLYHVFWEVLLNRKGVQGIFGPSATPSRMALTVQVHWLHVNETGRQRLVVEIAGNVVRMLHNYF
jgi:hypothetical protein